MHPYKSLDESAFWSAAVAQKNMFDIAGLWRPKYRIVPRMPVATFGSCFAQHIGRALRENGFGWMNAEPAPDGLSDADAKAFNYGVFSARTGNIYTAGLLAQWVGWALGSAVPPDEVWEAEGRFFDPFRPNVEPGGFESPEEMRASREMAIDAFRKCILEARVFVFTLGLTESWVHAAGGYEYPMCPGTVAGEFDAAAHQFVNRDYMAVRRSLMEAIRQMRAANPRLLFLLTVSPVPLTATMSGRHVLVATTESKAVLRAVAGSVAGAQDFIDYFPSYEIISTTPFRGTFLEPNQRSVNPAGVQRVMQEFFAGLGVQGQAPRPAGRPRADATRTAGARREDVVCEEALLEAFSARDA